NAAIIEKAKTIILAIRSPPNLLSTSTVAFKFNALRKPHKLSGRLERKRIISAFRHFSAAP
ncbi:MAG TPA: hypothetical protein VJ306_13890, partial [Pyrinomonadaceae bacterium]|nr:hypothetical protein [Pyrinomonadaceae bacterium]